MFEEQDRSWAASDTLVLVLLTVGTAFLYLVGLSQPRGFVYDEVHYVPRACEYQATSSEGCDILKVHSRETHPPLGSWLIAAGGRLVGNGPWGWRFFPAMAGIGTVALLYVFARHLHFSIVAATASALLLALDFMHFVNARAALLDVFVPFFGTGAFLLVWMDNLRQGPGAQRTRSLWLPLAGISLGLATASKWSGLYTIFGALALAVWCATRRARSRDIAHPLDRVIREQGASFVIHLVLVPAAVYMATYIGRLEGSILAVPWADASWLRSFWDQQFFMYRFHSTYLFLSEIQSPAWTWPLLKRPVAYFYEPTEAGGIRWINATGNPLVWWPGMVAIVYCAVRWMKDRSSEHPGAVLALGFLVTYLFWVPMSSYRTVWITYFLPAIPFMCLAIGFVVDRVAEWKWGRLLTWAYMSAVVAAFAFFYPVLTAAELSPDQRERRILFKDCDAPGWHVQIQGPEGPETRVIDSGRPPEGWCWGEVRWT